MTLKCSQNMLKELSQSIIRIYLKKFSYVYFNKRKRDLRQQWRQRKNKMKMVILVALAALGVLFLIIIISGIIGSIQRFVTSIKETQKKVKYQEDTISCFRTTIRNMQIADIKRFENVYKEIKEIKEKMNGQNNS